MKRTVPTAVLEAKMNRGNEDEENVFLSDNFYELLSLLQRAENGPYHSLSLVRVLQGFKR